MCFPYFKPIFSLFLPRMATKNRQKYKTKILAKSNTLGEIRQAQLTTLSYKMSAGDGEISKEVGSDIAKASQRMVKC